MPPRVNVAHLSPFYTLGCTPENGVEGGEIQHNTSSFIHELWLYSSMYLHKETCLFLFPCFISVGRIPDKLQWENSKVAVFLRLAGSGAAL